MSAGPRPGGGGGRSLTLILVVVGMCMLGLCALVGVAVVGLGLLARRRPTAPKAAAVESLAAADPALAEAFAREVERTVAAGDGTFLDSRIDFATLMQRTLGGKGIPPQRMATYQRQIRATFRFGAQIVETLKPGGDYTFLRVHRAGSETRALFRLLLSEGGANYHDLILVTRRGEVVVADAYTLMAGELLSDTLRRSVLPGVLHDQKGVLDKALTGESDYVRHADEILAMVRANSPDQALAIYQQLPPSLQRDKNVMLARLKAASAKGWESAAYHAALNDFEAWFPDDPSASFVLLDQYFARKEFAKARQCIDAVEGAIGEDAHLCFVRGNAFVADGKLDLAEAAYEKGVALEPALLTPHCGLMDVARERRDWPALCKFLTRFESATGRRADFLKAVPEYAEFLQTAEFRAWEQSRQAPKPATALSAP